MREVSGQAKLPSLAKEYPQLSCGQTNNSKEL
jgi:hypothetical protein